MSDETTDKVGVWVQLGSTLVLLGFTTYLKIRSMLAQDGIPDSQMETADAMYAKRIEMARREQL